MRHAAPLAAAFGAGFKIGFVRRIARRQSRESNMEQVTLGLVGGGTVGGGVWQAIRRNGALMASRLGVELKIAKIAVRDLKKARQSASREVEREEADPSQAALHDPAKGEQEDHVARNVADPARIMQELVRNRFPPVEAAGAQLEGVEPLRDGEILPPKSREHHDVDGDVQGDKTVHHERSSLGLEIGAKG
jgi:hypothetical protein